jgi:hypothetical protein
VLASAGIMVGVLVVGVWGRSSRTAFEVGSSSADFQARTLRDGTMVVDSGEARLLARDWAVEIAAASGTQLQRAPSGVRLRHGTARFEVEHQNERAFRVFVSSGVIEVTGTRFLVTQAEASGSVFLERGAIRFISTDGRVFALEPGETLRWPLLALEATSAGATAPGTTANLAPSAPAPGSTASLAPAPAAPATSSTASPATSPGVPAAGAGGSAGRSTAAPAGPSGSPVLWGHAPGHASKHNARRSDAPAPEQGDVPRDLVQEIEALRIRHEYAALSARLDEALARQPKEPLRETLSFELCDALSRQPAQHDRACAQLSEHLRRYPVGDYTSSVKKLRREAACGP